MGADYRYTWYERQSVNFGTIPAGSFGTPPAVTGSYELDSHQVTVRLNYRFGGPVVTRY